MPFIHDVKRLRIEAGWTQEQLAKETGLLRPSIARIENGEREPSAESMWRIARAFGLRPDDIFQFVEAKPAALVQRVTKAAKEVLAAGGKVVVCLIALLLAEIWYVRFEADRAWATGDYFQARKLQGQIFPVLHPWMEYAQDAALNAGAACRPGRGQPARLPSLAQSQTWLAEFGGLQSTASLADAGGNLYHQALADCLDRVRASTAAVAERRALIENPWIPGPFNSTNDYSDYVNQASRAAILGDSAAAKQLLSVVNENHHDRLVRMFAFLRLPYHLEVLRPVFIAISQPAERQ